MISLSDDILEFDFADLHPDANYRISFQRTLRLPFDDTTYALPAGLGEFPLRHLDDFAEKLPVPVRRRGCVLMPMWQSEAMWIHFHAGSRRNESYPFAVKIATGKINAVTGKSWTQTLNADPQDYLVLPSQPWLDGFCVEKGKIRQFVAATLGDGQTVEEQLTGRADDGGIQIVVYPMKAEIYEERAGRTQRFDLVQTQDACFSNKMEMEMELGAGGLMRQEIYEDEYGIEVWDMSNPARVVVTILNAQQWHAVTGHAPISKPIDREDYSSRGIPWFDWYNADLEALAGSTSLAKIKPVPIHEPLPKKILGPTSIKPIGPSCRRKVQGPDISLGLADELRTTLQHMSALERELDRIREGLAQLLQRAQDAETGSDVQPCKPQPGHTKGPRTRLSVNIDGKKISGDVAADVFAEAVAEFGLGRVARSGAKLSGYPMVAREQPPKIAATAKLMVGTS